MSYHDGSGANANERPFVPQEFEAAHHTHTVATAPVRQAGTTGASAPWKFSTPKGGLLQALRRRGKFAAAAWLTLYLTRPQVGVCACCRAP